MNKRTVLILILAGIMLLLSSCYKNSFGCSKCEFFNSTSYSCQRAACCSNKDCSENEKCFFPGEPYSKCLPENSCYDKTLHNQCSKINNGNICLDAELYEDCTICKCKKGYKCVNLSCEKYETLILMVHGFNSDHYAWKRFENWFTADKIKTYHIDLVPSIGNITILSYQLMGKIKSVIKTYNIDRVDIVAHSMGGLVTRTYINSDFYDNEINKLIMIGTPNQGVLMSGFESFQLEETIASKQMNRNSDFMIELNSHDLNENVSYYTIIGTKYAAYGIMHDGLVLEEEVKLPGVDFITFDLSHSELVNSYDVYLEVKRKLEE